MDRNSRLPGFYQKPVAERLALVAAWANLSPAEQQLFLKEAGLPLEKANVMIENVVGTFPLPLGIATNFLINGKDYLIPMAVEETSIVAGASNAAKLAREGGGFQASTTDPVMIGQVQLLKVPDPQAAAAAISAATPELIDTANRADSLLVSLGGGLKSIQCRPLQTARGPMLIVHLLVDVRDAMGANAVNTMAERITPLLEQLSGGHARLRIISNLAIYRLARAEATWPLTTLGEEAVEGILDAWAFGDADPFRGTTHNKGIMNGIDAVAIAAGQDFRALEAGAHAYAGVRELVVPAGPGGRPPAGPPARQPVPGFAAPPSYRTLTRYERTPEGLKGSIELPLAVGTVGGSIRTNPVVQACLKILGVQSAQELAGVLAAVGLAQNFAALHALSTVGIQHGHMRLHARNIAISAGAAGPAVDRIAQQMVQEKAISVSRAKELLAQG